MSVDYNKYPVIEFSKDFVDDKIYADKQLAKGYFVTKEFLGEAIIEVEMLTASRFARAVTKNFIYVNYWRFIRLIYNLGFLSTEEGEKFRWSHFRFTFWKGELWQSLARKSYLSWHTIWRQMSRRG